MMKRNLKLFFALGWFTCLAMSSCSNPQFTGAQGQDQAVEANSEPASSQVKNAASTSEVPNASSQEPETGTQRATPGTLPAPIPTSDALADGGDSEEEVAAVKPVVISGAYLVDCAIIATIKASQEQKGRFEVGCRILDEQGEPLGPVEREKAEWLVATTKGKSVPFSFKKQEENPKKWDKLILIEASSLSDIAITVRIDDHHSIQAFYFSVRQVESLIERLDSQSAGSKP